jgi:ankyrin repeat protein
MNLLDEIFESCKSCNLTKIDFLLNFNSDSIKYINYRDLCGITPLIYAIKNGQRKFIEFLLENGADVNLKDINENSPLIYAIQFEQFEIIEIRQIMELIHLNSYVQMF